MTISSPGTTSREGSSPTPELSYFNLTLVSSPTAGEPGVMRCVGCHSRSPQHLPAARRALTPSYSMSPASCPLSPGFDGFTITPADPSMLEGSIRCAWRELGMWEVRVFDDQLAGASRSPPPDLGELPDSSTRPLLMDGEALELLANVHMQWRIARVITVLVNWQHADAAQVADSAQSLTVGRRLMEQPVRLKALKARSFARVLSSST
ncbi:hypothetical protein AURDEDRAFT_177541 [Auricularia subglabra TFB-10046 SS5]|uniref:Uncharacterized protein n=1 Tax=Auricularia subglabra (strain TFB-10046 / SS5) TaxID=717982 RepID=J0LAD3_AURST|nr:hypothetical protein AURDEDRAFT_177541 [Auricularia subglabra TFB-10046 SS5]